MEKNKETIEEASEKYSISCGFHKTDVQNPMRISFEIGAKWQEERSYSEEDIILLLKNIINEIEIRKQNIISNSKNLTVHLLEGGCIAFESSQDVIKECFKQFKK